MTSTAANKMISVDYEIFGKVQGVFFRKYTQEQGTKLKVVGWVMNTDNDTVKGQIQGKETDVKKMKDWLRTTGSPKSKIEKAEFRNEKEISNLDYTSFEHRK